MMQTLSCPQMLTKLEGVKRMRLLRDLLLPCYSPMFLSESDRPWFFSRLLLNKVLGLSLPWIDFLSFFFLCLPHMHLLWLKLCCLLQKSLFSPNLPSNSIRREGLQQVIKPEKLCSYGWMGVVTSKSHLRLLVERVPSMHDA